MHHFDGAAGEAKGHGPERALAGPVGDLIECCSVVEAKLVIWGCIRGQEGTFGRGRKKDMICVYVCLCA